MTPLFGRRAERAAAERAADQAVERLCSLPRAALAAEVMDAFGDEGTRWMPFTSPSLTPVAASEWLLRGLRPQGRHLRAIQSPVRDALRALEDAGLIEWSGSRTISAKARLAATAPGRVALAERSVSERVEELEEEQEEG
jgi:hypothetical protein